MKDAENDWLGQVPHATLLVSVHYDDEVYDLEAEQGVRLADRDWVGIIFDACGKPALIGVYDSKGSLRTSMKLRLRDVK